MKTSKEYSNWPFERPLGKVILIALSGVLMCLLFQILNDFQDFITNWEYYVSIGVFSGIIGTGYVLIKESLKRRK